MLDSDSVNYLVSELSSSISGVFEIYSDDNQDVIIDRCDGKQVFGTTSAYFSKHSGVDNKMFKKAIYRKAARMDSSKFKELINDILSKFS